ncbi:MAG: EAL domain-containing protein [Pseudomonadota bacterium]
MAGYFHADPAEEGQHWTGWILRRPTTHYVFALLLIACASVSSHWLLVGSLANLEEDSTVINTSGRQRMLSEQTIRLAGELMVADSAREVASLRQKLTTSRDLMRDSHKDLLARLDGMPAVNAESEPIRNAYFGGRTSLDDRLRGYFSSIDDILAAEDDAYSVNMPAYRAMVTAHRDGLLGRLDGVVKLYELQSQERLRQSEQLHVYLVMGALLLLLVEALFIFRPLVNRLTKARDDLIEQNAQMARMAVSDTLTQLPNRSGFGQRLDTLIDAQSGKDRCVAIMMMDLDRFKNVNDTLGHNAGDRVLVEVGQRIRGQLSTKDTVARLGGDEFAIILRNLSGPQDASGVAKKIISSVSRPVDIDGVEASVGASVGITIFPDTTGTASELMKCADLALYQAKNNGRGQYCFYDPVMQEVVVRKGHIADELRRACIEDHLEVFLQPIFSFETGRVEYAESLIRWRHETRGLIPAGEFIDIIDEFQMAAHLEAVVYRQVFGRLAAWREEGLDCPTITLNVSGVNLRQPDFCDRLLQSARSYSVTPSKIALEILETVFVDRGSETVISNISKLNKLGFTILLDDFGTGYASLSHLMDIPVDGIKIDKSFVQDVGQGGASEQIASSVLSLAQNLDLMTVGEGIESPDQLAYLQDKGCDYGQGYHFSKPIPMDEFEELLRMGAFGINSDHTWIRERRSGT